MNYQDYIIKATNLNLPWETLGGCNILITGATGLIGSCLVEILMSHPHKDYIVYASGRNEERAKERFNNYINSASFRFIKYDVLDSLDENIEFQYIIHAASNASPNFFASKPVEVIKSNVEGLINVMEYGLQHNLKRLLFISTGEVYGEGDGRIFTEDYSGYVNPTLPRSCYPSSKRAAETLCVSYSMEYGVETVIARPCHIYGPKFTESDNRVYTQFIRNIIDNENIVMKSSGTQYRSWCYVVDCASAILYILLKGENGQAYNIADESSNVTIKELAEMIAEIGGAKVVIDIPNETENNGYNIVTKSIFSTEKLKSLGWKIEGTMKEKLASTINCLLSTLNL